MSGQDAARGVDAASTVTLIAAVARNGVIGRDGDLPWHLPGDLPRLKRITTGHVVVMGRRTFDSIGRPLPGRTTVVLSRDRDWSAEGVTVCHDIEDALRVAAEADPSVYVLGGAEIYRLAMPYADTLLISEVPQSPDGDTYFPDVDAAAWAETERETQPGFDIVTYRRRH